jgi:hypothetical protein
MALASFQQDPIDTMTQWEMACFTYLAHAGELFNNQFMNAEQHVTARNYQHIKSFTKNKLT